MQAVAPLNRMPEPRVTLANISWLAYQQILQALPDRRGARLTYDRGALEISMPSQTHEFTVRLMDVFVRILVVERGNNLKTLGSTTINYPELLRGAEPDGAYYIQNQAQVAGRAVNFATDPPPDLVVEVDISHPDIDKNQLYAVLGVPEFWRYDGQTWQILHLEQGVYQDWATSPTFPGVNKDDLYEFLLRATTDEAGAERWWREQVRCRF